MREDSEKTIMRDRTYREVDDGDYLTKDQYMVVAVSLCVTHFLFELMYIWLKCTPMIFINIVSILAYVVSIFFIRKGHTLITVWIMVLEVFLHVIFASIFMGMACGFQLWLFGTFSSVFLPFFIPDLTKSQKLQIGIFSAVIVDTFLILTALNAMGLLPTRYNIDPAIANIMYYCNAVLAFGSISLYTGVYNMRMAAKSRELRMAAEHDYLTGIYNRQRMHKILDAEILREQELNENRLSIAIVDIDFFKRINDTFGHDIGDEALKTLADIFFENMDKGLLYARWGGEEFMLVAPENLSYKEFAALLENLRKRVEENELIIGDKKIKFTISIGAAAFEKGMTFEALVNTADDRLYEAKNSGRNKVVY